MKVPAPTFLVALAVAALVGFTIFDNRSSQKTERDLEEKTKLIYLAKAEVRSIEVAGQKAGKVAVPDSVPDSAPDVLLRLEKQAGHWQITQPFVESADQQAVETHLDQLSLEKAVQTVKEGDGLDFKTYGLRPPQFTVTLATPTAHETVKVGTIKAYDGSLYAQRDDENKVVLVNSSWDVLATQSASHFRDTKTYRGPPGATFDRILVDSPFTNFELNQVNGKYEMKGATDPIDQAAVQTWLEQIKALRGAAFVDAPKPGFKSSYTIQLMREGKIVSILKSARDPAHAANQFEVTSSDLPGGEKSRVLVSPSALVPILLRPDSFYDRRAPFRFKIQDVASLRFHDSKTSRDLNTKVDSSHPDGLLTKIAELEGVRFLGPICRVQLAQGQKFDSRLTLFAADGRVVFEMSWSELVTEPANGTWPEARFLLVKTNLSKQVIGVPEKQIASLSAKDTR